MVLCLDRALFRKDIAVLRKRLRLSYVTVSAKRLRRVQERWVAPRWRLQTYFTGWLDREARSLRPLLERFGIAFLRQASRTHPVAAVLSGNMDYWQDDALKLACAKLGIPFFVLCRENYVWEAGVEDMKTRVAKSNFRFLGDGVAVASESTYRSLTTSGGFAEGVVRITGFPRFDEWFGLPPMPYDARSSITLFSFADPLYLAPIAFEETLNAFLACADANEGKLDFVIKVKKPSEIEELGVRFPQLVGRRVRLTADQSLIDLTRNSRLVIGYNSLAILEALLAGPAIAVPWWGDSVRNARECVMHGSREIDRQHAYFPQSPEELSILIAQAAALTLQPKGNQASRIARFSEQSLFSEERPAAELVEAMLLTRIPNPATASHA